MRSPFGRGKKGQRKQPRPNYRKAARAKAKQASQEENAAPTRVPNQAKPGPVASPDPPAPPRIPERRKPDAVSNPVPPAAPLRAPEPREPSIVVSLDPLAPVIVRSGRPFDDRSDADPARFPPPSTVAGCLRTAWARATGLNFGPELAQEHAEMLAQTAVAGPLLLDRKNRILAPKPADALYFGRGDEARCVRAEPRAFDPGVGADLPDALMPVQLIESVAGKSGSGPAWWSWEDLLTFRLKEELPAVRTDRTGENGRTDGMSEAGTGETEEAGENGGAPPPGEGRRTRQATDPNTGAADANVPNVPDAGRRFYVRLCKNGWSPPQRGDRRTHVAINPDTRAADAGRLFQTEGLDLDAPDAAQDRDLPTGERRWPAAAGGLRLLARCGKPLGEALVHLGGERRLAALQPESEQSWPSPPPGWFDRIACAGGLSLTLLTPAIFSAGYRPGWLDADLIGSPPAVPGLRLQLRAAAVERWQPHSGWDLAQRRPRPSRKLAGAGATYWFRILDGVDSSALTALWLASVSDCEQDRRDGFGLALPSPWEPVELPADHAT